MTRLALALALLVLASTSASAQSVQAIFDRGNAAYGAARYDDAVAAYQELVDLGIDDADVHYDLGLALARTGRLGAAMVSFERTLRLRPGDDDAREALDAAEAALARRRAALVGEAETSARGNLLDGLAGIFPEQAWALALLVATLLASVAAAGLVFARRESARLGFGIALAVAALVAGVAGVAVAARRGTFRDGTPAIVVGTDAALRDTPDPRSRVTHPLAEGERVEVIGVQGQFADVLVPGRGRGWARRADIGTH